MPADPDPSAVEIADLVRRCLGGEAEAAGALVARFERQVFALCYRMLGQREDAEDVAQESFVRALRSLRSWDAERDFAPWLLAIAGNRCRTWLSARARRPRLASEVERIEDSTPPPEAARNLAEEVERALGGIRAEYRQAFVLFHEQELSYGEIAEAMGCPLGTVKTWVHRARREIVEQLRSREVLPENSRALRRV
ncbi:MAG TPA: RNA polymerase sigma factor [Pirellulales bacterium]|jgi:RNA polymerase sigma-70 factor (ECF subfamily)